MGTKQEERGGGNVSRIVSESTSTRLAAKSGTTAALHNNVGSHVPARRWNLLRLPVGGCSYFHDRYNLGTGAAGCRGFQM